MTQNIILIGPMGAGKTSVGKQLARSLNMTFYDSDHEIEKRTGVNIPTIFEFEGEPGFREREHNVLLELVSLPNIVLATGGGAVLRPENRSALKDHGVVVYLQAPVEMLYKRTARDRNRPLLQTEDPKGKIKEILAIRDPLYRQTAAFTVDTNGLTVRQVVKKILDHLKHQP